MIQIKLLEFEPAKATDLKNINVADIDSYTTVEPKLDGVRAIVHCTMNGVIITSRRINKQGEYNQIQDKIPHIRDNFKFQELCKEGYTIFDGELVSDSFSNTMSVIGSKDGRDSSGVKLYLFDTIRYRGENISNYSQYERFNIITNYYFGEDVLPITSIHTVSSSHDYRDRLVKDFIDSGLEGAILKRPFAGYFDRRAWVKIKQLFSVDAVVTGWTAGKGKYKDTIGSLICSVYDSETGDLVELCRVSPGDDSKRHELFAARENIQEKEIVVEITAQCWTEHGSLRHPRILRYRNDRSKPNIVKFDNANTTVV